MTAVHELENDTPFPVALSLCTRICQNIFAGTLMDLYTVYMLDPTRMTEVREEEDAQGGGRCSGRRKMLQELGLEVTKGA